jgi:enoyl-CoA hydratase/carnithine racemase
MPVKPAASFEIAGHVATVFLDRPESENRVNERMAADLRDAVDALEHDETVWVVVLTGRGDAFCRGSELPEGDSDFATAADKLRVSGRVASCRKPVIAGLNGDATDQGLEIALACDYRLAANEARLGLTHTGAGLIPWDGGTQRLSRLIGQGRAMEMVLTGRTIDSREAAEIGLVDRAVPGDDVLKEAQRLAEVIADHGPIAARYAKEAVRTGQDLSMEQGLRLEADLNILLQSTADRAEGIRSFLEKRRPNYRGE